MATPLLCQRYHSAIDNITGYIIYDSAVQGHQIIDNNNSFPFPCCCREWLWQQEDITALNNIVEAMKFEMVQLDVAHYFFMEYFAIILSCL